VRTEENDILRYKLDRRRVPRFTSLQSVTMNARAIGQTERYVMRSEAAATASSDDSHAAEQRQTAQCQYHSVQNGGSYRVNGHDQFCENMEISTRTPAVEPINKTDWLRRGCLSLCQIWWKSLQRGLPSEHVKYTITFFCFSITFTGQTDENLYTQNSPKIRVLCKDVPFEVYKDRLIGLSLYLHLTTCLTQSRHFST